MSLGSLTYDHLMVTGHHSYIAGITLTTNDSNLHQHGKFSLSLIHLLCSLSLTSLLTAMQMWTLARFLPLVIGHMIPEGDAHWENFLRLLDIVDILFARPITTEHVGYLEALISDHHSCFKDLYPNASITMKMHSMIHMPRLILQ